MKNIPTSIVRECLMMMIQPISAFCISRGLHFQDFLEIAKRSFVQAAEQKLNGRGKKNASVSRLSVMTGLQRPEVTRLRAGTQAPKTRDFIARVIGQWTNDKRFVDRKKNPRPLTATGKTSEFHRLVQAVSKDLNPHTVHFELTRLGMIRSEDGVVTLLQQAHMSTGDIKETLRIASEDVRDLLVACEENAFAANDTPNLHARTQYDNVPDHLVPAIRAWCLEFGGEIHARIRDYLSQCDRDINHNISSRGGRNRVTLGTFSRVQPIDDEESSKTE